jgi:hypothetical protein
VCSARALSSVRARRKAPGALRASSTLKRWGAPQMESSNEIITHNINDSIWFKIWYIYGMIYLYILYIYDSIG